MREVVFRGKRIDNGEWIEGYYAGYDLICPNEPESTYNATGDYYGQTPYVGFIEVDPETVGQYTGLKDKNGKRIFEGDIVRIDGKNYEVQYLFGQFFVGINMPIAYKRFGCEVIGNIHDNPELLEVR